MKRTKITYRIVRKDRVEVISVENVARLAEIGQEFGGEVEDKYYKGEPVYFRNALNDIVVRNNGVVSRLEHGIINKDDFSHIVSDMKAAGNRLQRIKIKVAEETVKEILI